MIETSAAVGQITRGIDWWLRAEIAESHAGRNVVLDDYEKTRRNFTMPIDDPSNMSVKKAEGHYMRFRTRLERLDEDTIRDDGSVGRIIHHALMFVSGGFRKQCMLEAGSVDEYEQHRLHSGRAAGIEIGKVVASESFNIGDTASEGDIAQVVANCLFANEVILQGNSFAHDWFAANPHLAAAALDTEEPPVQRMLETQKLGVRIATDFVILAAAFRDGEVADVPVLEPKSISDAAHEPIYPFAA